MSGKLKSTPIVSECSPSTGPTSGDGTTCEPSRPLMESGASMLSAGDSRARTLLLEEPDWGWLENVAASGLSTSESFAFCDLDSLSLKTPQLCLFGGLSEFCATLPPAGLMRNGKLFARPILLCRTVENACSLLPTPTASMGKRGWGLSRTGRLRYSQTIYDNAMRHGYKPPITLLEWMMGFEERHTDLGDMQSAMPSSPKSPNGSDAES